MQLPIATHFRAASGWLGRFGATAVVLVSLALLVTVASSARGQGQAVTIADVGDGSDSARRELMALADSTCMEQAIIDYASWVLAAEADKDATEGVWLKSAPFAYVGRIEDAITSLQGTLRSQTNDQAVALVDLNGTAALLRFSSLQTPLGRTVWYVTSKERAIPDSACGQ